MFFFIDNFRQAPPYFYTGVPSHGSWRPVKAIAYLCSFCTDISQTVSNVPYHYTAFLLYFLYVFTPENFIILGIHNLFPLRIGWEPAAEFLNSRVRQPSWEKSLSLFLSSTFSFVSGPQRAKRSKRGAWEGTQWREPSWANLPNNFDRLRRISLCATED